MGGVCVGPTEDCALCPRLAEYRVSVLPKNPLLESYWNRPVPSFGDSEPWLLVVGLAPGAHGANRTGRPFAGDAAGVLLYGAIHECGLSDNGQVTDGKVGVCLRGVRITNAVRCVPPRNKPSPSEFRNCRKFLAEELRSPSVTDVLCIGADAWREVFHTMSERAPRFRHGASERAGRLRVAASFHTSRYNQNTNRISTEMVVSVLRSVMASAGR